MVEPVDPDDHVAAPRLPHALDTADEGQVRPTGGQEHSAVTDADHLSTSHDGLVEELLSLAFHAASLKVCVKRGQVGDGVNWTLGFSKLDHDFSTNG